MGMVARIGQQIERLPAAHRARDDDIGQPRQPQALILLRKAGDLGLDHLIGFGVQRALGVPIGESDDGAPSTSAKTVT